MVRILKRINSKKDKNICTCYRKTKYSSWNNLTQSYENIFIPECYGTKEREKCNCNGNLKKCDFYPEVRANAKNI